MEPAAARKNAQLSRPPTSYVVPERCQRNPASTVARRWSREPTYRTFRLAEVVVAVPVSDSYAGYKRRAVAKPLVCCVGCLLPAGLSPTDFTGSAPRGRVWATHAGSTFSHGHRRGHEATRSKRLTADWELSGCSAGTQSCCLAFLAKSTTESDTPQRQGL